MAFHGIGGIFIFAVFILIDSVQGGKIDDNEKESSTNSVCESGSYFPDENDCNKFYQCANGRRISMSCPIGLFWDNNYKTCTRSQSGKCNPKSDSENRSTGDMMTTTIATTIITTTTTKSDIISTTPENSDRDKETTEIDSTTALSSQNEANDLKIVCYFTNWAGYRDGMGKYEPENVDPSLCTHIIYGFAVLDDKELVMKPHDSFADIDKKYYEHLTSLSKKGIKVLIGLGGWSDSSGDKYSRLVSNAEARKKFVVNTLKFIHENHFAGLDIDWEFPVCWQTVCNKDRESDKDNFNQWIIELNEAFKTTNLLLSVAVSPSKNVIDNAYNVPVLAEHVDWISVMAYDYHGHWDKKTGHVAPLYDDKSNDENKYLNADFTIKYWIKKGAPPNKLVMGIPMYGKSFTLTNERDNGYQAPATGAGLAGNFTKESGSLAFYEICSQVKNQKDWKVVHDDLQGTYATKNDQWVGYDDVSDVAKKANYIIKSGLGGGMIWDLDYDDFNGVCKCQDSSQKYPLLTTLVHGLRGKTGEQLKDCT